MSDTIVTMGGRKIPRPRKLYIRAELCPDGRWVWGVWAMGPPCICFASYDWQACRAWVWNPPRPAREYLQRPIAPAGRRAVSCGECGGSGRIVNDGPYSTCDDCNGSGFTNAERARA